MTTVFLSHISPDKPAVRRLAQDLKEKGVDVWFDEEQILVGESFVERIQEGIEEADFVAIWLTRNAVKSGWVTREWESRLLDEIKDGSTRVLPLLAEDCDLPIFLKLKQFADFRSDYATGFQQLLKSLDRPETTMPLPHVSQRCSGFLDDLAGSKIELPLQDPIDLIPSLKALPRTGKKLRLAKDFPEIPIRSVYDHVLSVAHSADCFFSVVQHNLGARDVGDLSRHIVYHDLCEVLVGDLPVYTNVEDYEPDFKPRVTEKQKRDREKAANQFLLAHLGPKQRDCLERVTRTRRNSKISRFFAVLDTLDPIIAIWRYLHVYRGKLGKSCDDFIFCLRDFFENPRVQDTCSKSLQDERVHELARLLQDQLGACTYYRDRSQLSALSAQCDIEESVLSFLIEGHELEFVEPLA